MKERRMAMRCLMLAAGLISFLLNVSFAQEAAQAGKKTESPSPAVKTIEGTVTWIRPDRIAVVYKKDPQNRNEEEMLLPVSDKVVLDHARSISDIAAGDTVYIEVEDSPQDSPDGPRLTSKAVKIGLIRKGVKTLPIGESAELEKKENKGQVLRTE